MTIKRGYIRRDIDVWNRSKERCLLWEVNSREFVGKSELYKRVREAQQSIVAQINETLKAENGKLVSVQDGIILNNELSAEQSVNSIFYYEVEETT